MTKPHMTLKIAEDFSKEPAGRYRGDGDASGEVFREERLIPALKKFDRVTVDLDGTEGYGSSFLEEAFGGLLRSYGMNLASFESRVELRSQEDPSLIDEILQYVKEQDARSSKSAKH